MTRSAVKRLEVGSLIALGGFGGTVTCVDLIGDDKIVIKWDCAESEDVMSEASPLWSRIDHLC